MAEFSVKWRVYPLPEFRNDRVIRGCDSYLWNSEVDANDAKEGLWAKRGCIRCPVYYSPVLVCEVDGYVFEVSKDVLTVPKTGEDEC